MPAQEPVIGVARVVCRGTASGQPLVNVFHVQNGMFVGSAHTTSSITTLATNMATLYNTHFVPRMSTQYSGDDVEAVDLSDPAGASALVALSGTGSGAGGFVPASAACCVTWKIARRYRGGHPRSYIGALPTSAIESPTSLAAAYVTSASSSAAAFLAAVNALSISGTPQRLVAVHRTQNKLKLVPPLISVVTAAEVDSRIDSQRRRLGPDR